MVRLFGLRTVNTSAQAPAVDTRWKSGWANLSSYPQKSPCTRANSCNPGAEPLAQFSAVCWNAAKELNRRFVARAEQHPLGPSSTTRILGYFSGGLPDSNEICCMLNHQRRLTLSRPTAAPTATQLRVF